MKASRNLDISYTTRRIEEYISTLRILKNTFRPRRILKDAFQPPPTMLCLEKTLNLFSVFLGQQ